MKAQRRFIIPLFFAAVVAACSFLHLQSLQAMRSRPHEIEQEALYLPSGKGLAAISFGYRNALSDALWLKTVNYFGYEHAHRKDYRYLNHMCSLVTELNPKVSEPYYFCATMAAWELNQPEQAVAVLTKAIVNHPTDWLLYYQRGFYRMYFLQDSDGAKDDFLAASHQPDAPAIAARIASKMIANQDSPDTAIAFLQSMLGRTSDPTQRNAFEERIKELQHEQNLLAIEALAKKYESKKGVQPQGIQDLIAAGYISKDLRDPWDGEYSYSPTDQIASSSSAKKRLNESLLKQSAKKALPK